MRIGQIITLIPDRKFGFIRTEHFREDVFFHYSTLKDINTKRLEVGMDVEFEIDELLRINKQKLEATVVQIPTRPLSHKLEEDAMPEFRASHHPKARRRKPTWKTKPESASDLSEISEAGDTSESTDGAPTSDEPTSNERRSTPPATDDASAG